MLALERRHIIIEKLKSEGKVIVSLLSTDFGVSEETIRRDIDKLVNEGIAIKTYGGAVIGSTVRGGKDQPYNIRKKANVEQKQMIAKMVAELIHDGDRIMVDASSTALYVVREIKDLNNITIITNSVEILLELSDKQGWTILSTGGSLREGGLSLFGSSAEKMIRDHHVDIAICSAKGVDANMGITDSNERDAEMKKAIFNAASTKILCLDNSKFNTISFIKVCDLDDIDILVSDSNPGEAWKKRLSEKGVNLKTYEEDYENSSN